MKKLEEMDRELKRENEIPPDPTEVEVFVTFTRYQYGKQRASIDMRPHTDLDHAPRNRKVYKLTVPVPEDAFEEHRVAGEVEAEVKKVAEPCGK